TPAFRSRGNPPAPPEPCEKDRVLTAGYPTLLATLRGQLVSSLPSRVRPLQLAPGAHDISLRAATIGQPQHSADYIHRQFMNVMQGQDLILRFVKRFADKRAQKILGLAALQGAGNLFAVPIHDFVQHDFRSLLWARGSGAQLVETAVPCDGVKP